MPSVFQLFGELKLETGAFTAAVQRVESRLQNTTRVIGQQEVAAKELGKTNAVTARSYEKLRETLTQAENKFRLVNDAFNKGEATSKQLAAALRQLDNATERVNTRLKDSEARLQDYADSGKFTLAMAGDLGNAFTGVFNATRVLTGGLEAGFRALTAITSAGWNWINTASQMGSRIQDVKDRTGLTAETLTTLDVAAKQSGTTLEALVPALGIFAKNMAKSGEDTSDLDGALNKALETLEKMPPGIERMAKAKELFGKSGLNMIAVLASLDGSLDQTRAKFIRMGVTLSDDDVKAADAFGDSLEVLGTQAKVVSARFALQIAPEITKAMQWMTDRMTANHDAIAHKIERTGDLMRGIAVISQSETAKSAESWAKWSLKMISYLDPVQNLAYGVSQRLHGVLGDVADKGAAANDSTSKYSLVGAERDQFLAAERRRQFANVLGDGMDTAADKTEKMAGALKHANDAAKTTAVSFNSLLTAMRGGTMGQESGGHKDATNGRTGATGLFQVMPSNIAEWTQQALGRALSPEQFKASTAAQIAVFNKKMGEYLSTALRETAGDWQKAVRMAAAAWYGGPKAMGRYDDPTKFRKDEPSFRQYTNSVLSRVKKGMGGDFDPQELTKIMTTQSEAVEALSKTWDDLVESMRPAKSAQAILNEQLKDPAALKALADRLHLSQELVKAQLQQSAWLKDAQSHSFDTEMTPGAFAGRDAASGGSTGELPTNFVGNLLDMLRQVKAEAADMPPKIMAPWTNFWATMSERLNYFKEQLPSLKEALGENLVNVIQGIGDSFANAMASWANGYESFSKALLNSFRNLVTQIVAELERLLIMKAIFAIIGAFSGSSGNASGALGKLGTSARGFASGGYTGGGGTSSFAGFVHGQEFVMNAQATKNIGVANLEAMNKGAMPSSPSINITIQGNASQGTAEQIARHVEMALRRHQRRQGFAV